MKWHIVATIVTLQFISASFAADDPVPIADLQRFLNNRNCDAGAVDGEWGRKSQAALHRLSLRHGERISAPVSITTLDDLERSDISCDAPAQPPPDYGIENIWQATWVYPPHHKGLPFHVRDKAKWDKAAAAVKSPVPAVIYVHGCAGFDWDFGEAGYAKALSKAGFLVLAPDSYARGPKRKQVCGVTHIDTVELRRAEVSEVLQQLDEIPWVDKGNLFLAGHSEGAITTSMFKGSQFQAYFISAWTCTSRAPEFNRIHAPNDRPVLAVVGTNDEYHVGTFRENDHCGMRMEGRPGSKSIVLKGWDHDVFANRETIPSLVKLFQENIEQ